MPRNPYWTDQNAALIRSILVPDGTLQFAPSAAATTFDNIGSFASSLYNLDFVRVELQQDATYTFLASGSYQVSLTIYDAQGYLLQFVDGADRYPQDSITSFRPDYSGTFFLSISWEFLDNASGTYAISASEDRFSDGRNGPVVPLFSFAAAYANIMRASPAVLQDQLWANDISGKLTAGLMSGAQALDLLIDRADGTTSVATLAYQFFTGKIPGASGYDYLLTPGGPNPNTLNSPYYQTFNTENRYINFAVNLGKNGEGQQRFASEYGSLTLEEATKKAYAVIFGSSPGDAKVTELLGGGRDLYFELYGRDGHNGIGTKAAMVGWLLAEAAKADVGVYARANEAFLADLADGATYAVDLIGVYGRPGDVF